MKEKYEKKNIKNIFSKLSNLIINDSYSINRNLFNLMTATALVAGIFTSVSAVVMHLGVSAMVFSIFIILTALLSLFIAIKLNLQTFANILLVVFVNDACFPILYYISDGMNGGMPLWMLLGLEATILLLKKRTCIIVFTMNLLVQILTIVYGLMHPEVFVPMPNKVTATLDMLVALCLVTLAIGFVFKFEAKTYEKQQRKIIDAMRRADEANLIKSEFLSNISHDIRTPMNAIVGYSEIALQNCDDRKKLMDCFSKINIASEQLLNLINGILDMSQIEAGSIKLVETECSLQSVINDVTEILDKEIIAKNINLQIDYSQLWEDAIICDKPRLIQIIQNVLSNAVQYSYDNKPIYISVSQPAIDNEQGIARTQILVRDEGCGINSKFLQKIFDPFERERLSGKTEVAGIGLGLSITRKLVQLMNGKIEIKSKEGKGTEVLITIPFTIQTLTEITDEANPDEILIKGKRILVAEDNSLNREIVKDMLQTAGCQVEEARDGTFAVDMVNLSGEGYYDLILMDIQMPMMDGFEATRIIRSFQNERLRKIPIVALSANAFQEDKKKAFDCGMDAFISKPVSSEKLARVLNVILNGDKKREFVAE